MTPNGKSTTAKQVYVTRKGAVRAQQEDLGKNTYSLDDLIAQTSGVECRKEESFIDEIPADYKPIEQVMANQNDLVEVVATLKQVLCIKG